MVRLRLIHGDNVVDGLAIATVERLLGEAGEYGRIWSMTHTRGKPTTTDNRRETVEGW